MSIWPEVERGSVFTGPVLLTGERASLESWLDYHRATLLMKCAGLSPGQRVLRSCPPSRLSLLGLVRHMTEVESWFHDFDGGPEQDGYWTEEQPDAAPPLAEEQLTAAAPAAEEQPTAAE